MHMISWKKLDDFIWKHPTSKNSLKSWFKIMKFSNFNDFNHLREVFKSADQVGKFIIFNISGNHFRIVSAIHFNRQKVFIRYVLTHSEYDKENWKKEIV
jgi:mRNA interferase HigB